MLSEKLINFLHEAQRVLEERNSLVKSEELTEKEELIIDEFLGEWINLDEVQQKLLKEKE